MTTWTDETAEWYAEHYGEYATNRLAVEQLDLTAESTVVDVGCGTGAALRSASDRVTGGKLIGVDPVRRMVEIARDRTASSSAADRIEFRRGPAEKLPVEDAIAHTVLAFDSYDHWDDKARGLAEILRILRPHGVLIVTKDKQLPGGKKAVKQLKTELEAAGFAIFDERSIDTDEASFYMLFARAAE